MTQHVQHQNQKLENIEWIRAIASILVVAVHYSVFGDSSSSLLVSGITLEVLLREYIARLAVCLFMITSLFLFSTKNRDLSYLKPRVKKFLLLGTVWPFIFYTCGGGLTAFIGRLIEVIKSSLQSPFLLFHYFFSSVETVYYFFISLAVITYICFFLQKQRHSVILLFLVITSLVISALPLVSSLLNINIAVIHNPVNFFSYAPIAILINRNYEAVLRRHFKIGFFVLFIGVVLAFLEVHMALKTGTSSYVLGYSKNSLVCLSTGIFMMSFGIKKSNSIIKFMADFSLPLYLLHTCIKPLVGTLDSLIFVKSLGISSGYVNVITSFFMGVGISYFLARFILPRTLSSALYTSR